MAKTPIKNVYVKVAGAVCSDVAHKGGGALALLAALTETEPDFTTPGEPQTGMATAGCYGAPSALPVGSLSSALPYGDPDGDSGRLMPPFERDVPNPVPMTREPPGFGTVTHFKGDDVTIFLRGTVENVAALELGAILDAAIDCRPASMVLDVAELEFLGATGLLAVSDAEKRLAASGITLTLRWNRLVP